MELADLPKTATLQNKSNRIGVTKMSLNWNATKVENLEELHKDEAQATKTAYLAYALMFAEIGTITEANWLDVYTRISIQQKLQGTVLINQDGTPNPFTMEDVHRRIGYSTNVSTVAFSKWMKRYYDNKLADYTRKAKEEGVN